MGSCFTKDKTGFTAEGRGRQILSFALPAAGFGIFQQAFGLIYTALVSRELSVSAIAVLAACGAFVSMQSFVANGMTTGFGIYLSRCYGQGDSSFYRKGFTAAFVFLGILMILSAVLAAAAEPLMVLARIPEELWEDSRLYLTALLFGTGFLGFRNLMSAVLQGAGNSVFPGIMAAAGIVTQTLVLALAMRIGLGMLAPPLAVLFHNAVFGGVMFFYFKKYDKEKAGFVSLREIPRSVWREILANGFSKSGMMILVGIGGFFMQRAQNTLDTEVLAGSSLADTLSNFFLVPLSALAQTASVAAGQNMGRREYGNIRAYNRRLLICHVVCTGGILLISICFGRSFLCLLAGVSGESAVVEAGVKWLAVCMPAFFGLGAAMICRNSLQATGSYRKLIGLGFLEMGITIAFALSGVPRFGYTAYCASIAVKWTALGIAAGYWYWRRIKSLGG